MNALEERIKELTLEYKEAERLNLKSKAERLLVDINYFEMLIDYKKKVKKLEKIEQIVNSRDGFYLYDNLPPFQQIREVLEEE